MIKKGFLAWLGEIQFIKPKTFSLINFLEGLIIFEPSTSFHDIG